MNGTVSKARVVQDDVSRFGLRRVHLVRMGGKVEEGVYEGWRLVERLEYEEEGIEVWHLWLFLKKGDEA